MSAETITVLRSLKGRLAKVWRANGVIDPYEGAYHYEVEEHQVDGVEALSALLMRLAKQPDRCVIRGQWIEDGTVDNTRKRTRRQNVCFSDAPRRFLALDVDQFQPLASDPVLEPDEAAREFVETMLPAEFHDAAFHLQLSNSAGAPGKEGVLKAHLWFWLSEPLTGAQLTAWQKRTGAAFDPAFFRQVQINYTADPIFEEGVLDPVPVREVFVPGRPEVTLVLTEGDLAAEARPSLFDGTGADADDVARWLADNWTVHNCDAKGNVHIVCPFEADHGSAGGETSTTYMPSGNGYDQGHFKCLHGHCEHRTDADFLDAMGYQPVAPEEFPLVLPDPFDSCTPLPGFVRDNKGRIEATYTNATAATWSPQAIGIDIRFDLFRDAILYREPGSLGWEVFSDEDYHEVALRLEALGFKTPGMPLVKSAVNHRARKNPIDTAMMWGDSLVWDGVPRIETFLVKFFDMEDRPYHRAVALYAWTAMAGRIFSPGCQADMVPILAGGQGARKSSAIAAMVPDDHHRLMSLSDDEDKLARMMRGALVVELPELAGLKTKAIEGIKAWITKRREEWVPKFKEFTSRMGRRCLFWGTTNDDELFDDPTGARRWLPVTVGQNIDVEGIAAVRDQLWAEAIVRWRAEGVAWREAEVLARLEHGAYRVRDSWEEALLLWSTAGGLDGAVPALAGFTTRQALVEGLSFPDRSIQKKDEMRVGKALAHAGFKKERKRVAGKLEWIWTNVPTCSNLV